MIFSWDDENREHIAKHRVTPVEAEFVVEDAKRPFPQDVGDGKRRVWGTTDSGRFLQVIYVLKSQDEVEFQSVDSVDWAALQDTPEVNVARIIHAMEMTPEMKRQFRRRRK